MLSADAEPASETVTPGTVMLAVSPAPGTVLGLQLAAASQLPLCVLVHVMVAAVIGRMLTKRIAMDSKSRPRMLWIIIGLEVGLRRKKATPPSLNSLKKNARQTG